MTDHNYYRSNCTPHSEVVEEFVTAVGGYTAAGKLLGINGWVVKKWMLTDDVPERLVFMVCDIGKRYGLDIRPHDLHRDLPDSLHEELKWLER